MRFHTDVSPTSQQRTTTKLKHYFIPQFLTANNTCQKFQSSVFIVFSIPKMLRRKALQTYASVNLHKKNFHLKISCLPGNIKVLLYYHFSSPVPVKCYCFDLYHFFFAKSATHFPHDFNELSKTTTEILMHSTFLQKRVWHSHLMPVLLCKSVQYYITSSHVIMLFQHHYT
jgi:hypothetical protein